MNSVFFLNIILHIMLYYYVGGKIIDTNLGKIQGYFMKTRDGRSISAYTSIPFALPPVGELRFKAPVPITKWTGILNATSESPICVQRNPYIRQKEIVGQEDCLYLNVYTPYNSSKVIKLLPVMVWIHGGGWMCGDSRTAMYGPEYLLDKDIVFVAINYRLGPLGFLSTQDEHCPGNNGLKDQQEALRWVQKNIHSFGGNRHSVTIFGESAGGASVHYHMLSPTSTGLFHKAISQSGTALVPWAEAPTGEAIVQAHKLAKLLKCPKTSKALIECLRTKDSYNIIGTEFHFYSWDYEPMTPFKAVVEPDLPGAFLTKQARLRPDVISVPWITGLTEDEGCLKSVCRYTEKNGILWQCKMIGITANKTRFFEFSTNFNQISPVTFYYENSQNVDFITDAIRKFYLNGRRGNLTDDDKKGILNIYTDNYFAYPALEAARLSFEYTNTPIYLYHITYRATNSFSQIFGDPEGDYGVCHADDLIHLFPIYFLEKTFSEGDIVMSNLIVTMWTNFATTGNPNKPEKLPVRWIPLSNLNKMEHLEIGVTLKMRKHFAARSKFWEPMPLWHVSKIIIDEL